MRENKKLITAVRLSAAAMIFSSVVGCERLDKILGRADDRSGEASNLRMTTVSLQPNYRLVNTGVIARSGDTVLFTSTGTIDCSGVVYGPNGIGDGISPNSPEWLIPEVPRYIVGGKQANSTFPVGENRNQQVFIDGEVRLGINVRSIDGCSGNFQVQVSLQ